MKTFKEFVNEGAVEDAAWEVENNKRLEDYKIQAAKEKKFQEADEATFNKDFEKLAKSKKINGNAFTYEKGQWGYEIKFEKAGTPFSVEFINNTAGTAVKRVIQISTSAKPGVIEKPTSGRNATAANIYKMLDKFFTTQKWK